MNMGDFLGLHMPGQELERLGTSRGATDIGECNVGLGPWRDKRASLDEHIDGAGELGQLLCEHQS